MTLTLNTSEGGISLIGTSVSPANSGGASGTAWAVVSEGAGGTITYVLDDFYEGKVAMRFAPATGVTNYVERTITGARLGAQTVRFKLEALPTIQGQVFASVRTSGGGVIASLVLNSLGQMWTQDAAGTSSTPTGSLTINTWYRLEYWWTNPTSPTGGTISFRIYRGNSTTALISIDTTGGNNGTSNATMLRFGKQTAAGQFGPMIVGDLAYNDGTTTPPTLSLPSPDASYVALRGVLANVSAGTTHTIDLPTAGACTIGNYLIALIAYDNAGTLGGTADISSITDDASNVWSLNAATNDPAAINEGVTVAVAKAKIGGAMTNGMDVVVTTAASVTAKAIYIVEVSGINATNPFAVSVVSATGTGTAVAVAVTPTAADQTVLVAIGVEAGEGDPITLDSDTTAGTWYALPGGGTEDATATNNVAVYGAVKRVSSTSTQTYNATLATSRDWAAIAVVLAPPTPLDTPTGLAVVPSGTIREAVATWDEVANAVEYRLDLELLTPPSTWTVVDSFTTPDPTYTLTTASGLNWSRTYRARVTAIAAVD